MAMSDTSRPGGEDEQDDPFDGDTAADGFAGDSASDELDLGDDDTRLPWLEGADDEDEYEGYNTGQVLAFALIGLLLLGVIVGGIWWLSHRGADDELVADGSTIEAPDEPYKTKPANPGGMVADGTGDASFRVSEGESQQARLGDGDPTPIPGMNEPVPKPGFDSMASGADSSGGKTASGGDSATAGSAAAIDAGSVGVQIGAYSSRQKAEDGWSTLSGQYSALGGLRHRVVEGKADIGTVYRLQALPGDRAAADALCGRLKGAGLNCYVKP